MNSIQPTPIASIDVDKLELRKSEKEQEGGNGTGKKSYYLYHEGVKLRVFLPEMRVPLAVGSNKGTFDKLRAIDQKLRELIQAEKDNIHAESRSSEVNGPYE